MNVILGIAEFTCLKSEDGHFCPSSPPYVIQVARLPLAQALADGFGTDYLSIEVIEVP